MDKVKGAEMKGKKGKKKDLVRCSQCWTVKAVNNKKDLKTEMICAACNQKPLYWEEVK